MREKDSRRVFAVQDVAPGYAADLCTIQEILEWESGRPGTKWRVIRASKAELVKMVGAGLDVIPVGTVEFVEAALAPTHLSPLNIPEPLCTGKFTGRKVWPDISTAELATLFQEEKELFVKSASRCKEWAPDTIQARDVDTLPADKRLFASQMIDLQAEWRVFVFHDEILDARPYASEKDAWFIAPSLDTVKDMVRAYAESPPAYTLDVGVTLGGQTVIIEAHPFISCGLYGFASCRIPAMLVQAYYWQKRKEN